MFGSLISLLPHLLEFLDSTLPIPPLVISMPVFPKPISYIITQLLDHSYKMNQGVISLTSTFLMIPTLPYCNYPSNYLPWSLEKFFKIDMVRYPKSISDTNYIG